MIIARHVFSKQLQLQLENIDYTNLSHYSVINYPITIDPTYLSYLVFPVNPLIANVFIRKFHSPDAVDPAAIHGVK